MLLENPGPICLKASIEDHTVSDDVRPAARSKDALLGLGVGGIPFCDFINNERGVEKQKHL